MNPQQTPKPDNRTPYDVFTFYLAPAHITKPTTLTILKAEIKDIFNPHTGEDEPALVIWFEKAHRALKVNKTQTEKLFEITGTDDHTKWKGAKVVLSPGIAKSKKKTIDISKP